MNDYLSLKLRVISFFLIIMIVYVHSYSLNFRLDDLTLALKGPVSFLQYFISQGLFRLPTPIFFSISGYLFFLNMQGKQSEFVSKFKKRIRTVVIPYLLWSILGVLIYFTIQIVPQFRIFFNNELVINYSLLKLLNTIFFDPIPGQLWYLRDLIMLVFLSPIIYLLIKYLKFLPVLFFMFMWFYDFNFILLSNRALLFFTFGAFLSTKNEMLIRFKFSSNTWIYVFLWIVIFLFKSSLVYFNQRDLILINILHKTGILIVIWAVWNLYDYFFNKKEWTPANFYNLLPFTFFIYAFHEPFLTIVKKLLHFLLGKSEIITLFIYLIAPILIIYASVFAAYSIKRVTPKFYGIITGSR